MGTPVIMEHSDLLAQQLKNCVLIFRRDRRPRYPVNHLRHLIGFRKEEIPGDC